MAAVCCVIESQCRFCRFTHSALFYFLAFLCAELWTILISTGYPRAPTWLGWGGSKPQRLVRQPPRDEVRDEGHATVITRRFHWWVQIAISLACHLQEYAAILVYLPKFVNFIYLSIQLQYNIRVHFQLWILSCGFGHWHELDVTLNGSMESHCEGSDTILWLFWMSNTFIQLCKTLPIMIVLSFSRAHVLLLCGPKWRSISITSSCVLLRILPLPFIYHGCWRHLTLLVLIDRH